MLTPEQAIPWLTLVHRSDARVFTFVLVVVYPIVDYLFYFRLKSTFQIYIWKILGKWSLLAVCVWLIRKNGIRLSDFGEKVGSLPRTLIVSGLLLSIIALLVIVSKRQIRKPSTEQLSKAVGKVRRLIPVNGRERNLFVAVALTAGLCEEFLYRGWLLGLIGYALTSLWAGLLLSAILFGVAHAYQGRNGIVSTSVLGIVFGLMFIASGSLLPGQVLHIVIDLNNGLALGKIAGRTDKA